MKKFLICSLFVALICASYFVGRFSAINGLSVYYKNSLKLAVPKGRPTYGLPLTEYVSILTVIRDNDTNEAIRITEAYLDLTILEAKERYSHIQQDDIAEINKVLYKVSAYKRRKTVRGNAIENYMPNPEMEDKINEFLERF